VAGKRRPGPEGGIFEDCRESAEIAWDWLRGAADRGSGELKKFGDRAPGIGKSGLLAILDALPVNRIPPIQPRCCGITLKEAGSRTTWNQYHWSGKTGLREPRRKSRDFIRT